MLVLCLRKVGPFSIDIVVACYVYHNQVQMEEVVPFAKLVNDFGKALSKSGILGSLNTLADWGIIRTEYTEYGGPDLGRAGRVYSVSDVSQSTVKATYEQFWERIQEEVEREKRE